MNKIQLNNLVKPLIDIYDELEEDIIKDILSRLSNYDDTSGTMDWLLDKLGDLGTLDNSTLRKVKGNKKEVAKVLNNILDKAPKTHKEYMDILENYYDKGLLDVNPLSIYNSNSINRLINEALKDTTDIMNLIDTKVIEGTKKSYKKILNKAYIETASGVYTYQESIRNALKEFAKEGINIVHYENGKSLGIESVVRRDVITRVNKLVGDTDLENAKELGTNLVYVDQHLGARVRTKYMKNDYEAHAEWQGKVYMIEGSNEKYDNFVEKTGYGEMLGLKGINCYHDFRPFFEWEKIPDRIDEVENAEVYELFQKQRSYERDIRRLKREKLIAKDFYSEEEQKALNTRYSSLTNEYNDFLKENNLRRDYSREYVASKNSTKLSELYNTEANRNQFERYRQALGDKVPSNIEEFLKIKYNNTDDYEELKYSYSLKKHYDVAYEKGEISALIDFDTYKSIDSDIINKLHNIKTIDDIVIERHSKHFTDRIIGHVFDTEVDLARNGVEIDDVLNTLLYYDKNKTIRNSDSIKLFGVNNNVSINPTKKSLIQTNPLKKE